MTPVETLLQRLNQKYGFIASLLVSRDGRFLGRAGDPCQPVWNDPYNLFFRDAETIANTFQVLDEQPRPYWLSQGQREVVVFKLRPDVALGVVKDDPRGPLEVFTLIRQLDQELPSLFAGVDLAAG
jgi:hypothetical protein